MGFLYNFSGLKEVAIDICKYKDNKLKLVIVGDGDLYDELKRIKKFYDTQDKMILTGRKSYSEIPSLIASADICLLPSYTNESIMHDIVPIKLYEYMAMGKPVISTKLPGIIKEFGKDNGIIYADRTEDVFDTAIKVINSESIFLAGIKARQFAEKRDWNRITEEFEKILIKLI
jgi:glycosyltransferase involved in cell wall biosynthesis